MTWVKCTRKFDNQPIYLNFDTAVSIRWNDVEGFSTISLTGLGAKQGIVRVLEHPDDLLKAVRKADK